MGLSDRIQQDMVAAMRERAELRLSTLRMMKAAVKNREIEQRRGLEDQEVQQVLGTLIKQREDSAAQFLAGGRPELAAKEKAEIAIIEAYLPQALSAEEVEATVRAAIAETGATTAKDMGKAMKAAMARFQAAQQRVEGKLVSDTVKRLLASRRLMTAALQRRLLKELAYIVVLGTPLVLFFLIAMPRSNAVRLLKSLDTIQVSHTHFDRIERLAAQYGDYAACVGNNCLFQFQNRWLHRLRLAPLTQFSVMLQRSGSPADSGGGQVGAMEMAMLVNRDLPDGGAIASALVFERAQGEDTTSYQASITFGADGRPGRTVVTLSPGATARQRAHARSFNLQCLTRLGGCKSSRDLLPGVWDGARHIESVRNHPADTAARSSRWRAAAATFWARN